MGSSNLDERSAELVILGQERSMESVPNLVDGFQIIFKFSGRNQRHDLRRNSVSCSTLSAVRRKSIQFDLKSVTSARQKMRMLNVLKRGLVGDRLPVLVREKLAEYAAETAWDILLVSSSNNNNNRLNLHIHYKHVSFSQNINPRAAPRLIIIDQGASDIGHKKKIVDSSDCSICLEDFQVDSEAVRLPCSHMFHAGCINRWLSIGHSCPLCRFPMSTFGLLKYYFNRLRHQL